MWLGSVPRGLHIKRIMGREEIYKASHRTRKAEMYWQEFIRDALLLELYTGDPDKMDYGAIVYAFIPEPVYATFAALLDDEIGKMVKRSDDVGFGYVRVFHKHRLLNKAAQLMESVLAVHDEEWLLKIIQDNVHPGHKDAISRTVSSLNMFIREHLFADNGVLMYSDGKSEPLEVEVALEGGTAYDIAASIVED